jgi:foldase protein PrsA
MRIELSILVVGAGIAGVAALPGCGGDGEGFPDDAVAEVGGTAITKAEFESALRFATGRGNDPRDFAACVAAKRQPSSELGATRPADAELEEQCKNEYEQTKNNVMEYLIRAEWTRQEADARGITLGDSEVDEAIAKAEQSGFLNRATLSRAGVSESEVVSRIRESRLQSKVMERVVKQSARVSDQEIAAYYQRNPAALKVPERREMRIVITRSLAKARGARAALEAGRSWDSVAKEYSSHSSRNQGGRITATWRRENKAGLGATIFRAKRGELVGPIEDEGTWAVFVVDKVKPSYQPTLEQARDEITELLQPSREKRALDAYVKRYRAMTECAPGFRVPICKNGPKPPEGQPSA